VGSDGLAWLYDGVSAPPATARRARFVPPRAAIALPSAANAANASRCVSGGDTQKTAPARDTGQTYSSVLADG
jgi:hypothetical protein